MKHIKDWGREEDAWFTRVFHCLLDNGDDDTANEIKQDFYLWLLGKPHIFDREHSNLRSFLGGMARRFYLNWVDKQDRANVGFNNRCVPLDIEVQNGLRFNGEEIVDGFDDTLNPQVAEQLAWNWWHDDLGLLPERCDALIDRLHEYDKQYRPMEGQGLFDLVMLLMNGYTSKQICELWQMNKQNYSRLMQTIRRFASESGLKP